MRTCVQEVCESINFTYISNSEIFVKYVIIIIHLCKFIKNETYLNIIYIIRGKIYGNKQKWRTNYEKELLVIIN